MFNRKAHYFFLICTIFLSASLHAQRAREVDKTVSGYLERINYWGEVFKTPTDYNDSLIVANDRLMSYMKATCQDPATLRYGFEKAQESGLLTVTSEDSSLRFYCWDTWLDETLHCFDALVQYTTASGTKVNVISSISNLYKHGDPGSYFTDLVTVHTNAGKTVYLATDCNIAGDSKGYEVKAYTIEKDSLISIPFFKTGDKVTKSIDYAYRENYTGDSTGGYHGQFNSLHFSADKSKLFLPIISNTGIMNERYYIYKFEGDMFVYKKKGEDKHDEVVK